MHVVQQRGRSAGGVRKYGGEVSELHEGVWIQYDVKERGKRGLNGGMRKRTVQSGGMGAACHLKGSITMALHSKGCPKTCYM